MLLYAYAPLQSQSPGRAKESRQGHALRELDNPHETISCPRRGLGSAGRQGWAPALAATSVVGCLGWGRAITAPRILQSASRGNPAFEHLTRLKRWCSPGRLPCGSLGTLITPWPLVGQLG